MTKRSWRPAWKIGLALGLVCVIAADGVAGDYANDWPHEVVWGIASASDMARVEVDGEDHIGVAALGIEEG